MLNIIKCPRCDNKKIFETKKKVICQYCGLELDKKILKLIIYKSEIIKKKKDDNIMKRLLNTKDLESFTQLLNSISKTNYCICCFSIIDDMNICPVCGTIQNQINNTIDSSL